MTDNVIGKVVKVSWPLDPESRFPLRTIVDEVTKLVQKTLHDSHIYAKNVIVGKQELHGMVMDQGENAVTFVYSNSQSPDVIEIWLIVPNKKKE